MTNYSNPAGSLPADAEQANWNWLQNRFETRNSIRFTSWLSEQLDAIEAEYAHLVTDKSRQNALRDDLNQDESR